MVPPRVRRAYDVARAVVYEARAENLTFMAGSIAYHAFVSLLPLLVLLLLAVSSLADPNLADRVFDVIEAVLTPTGRSLVVEAVGDGDELSGVSVLGGVVLLWATLRIFRGLDQAFSDIYESEQQNSILDQLADGLLVLVTVVGVVVVAGLVRSAVEFGTDPVGTAVGTAAVVVGLTVAFLPMYHVFPDVEDLRLRAAVPGAVLAAVGVTALESAFRLYVQFSATSSRYGVLGGIVVLLTWLYFNGLVVLLGAAVNAVLTNRTEDVDVRPVIGDHRPGIGRTVGPAPDEDRSRAVVADRLRELAALLERADGGDRGVGSVPPAEDDVDVGVGPGAGPDPPDGAGVRDGAGPGVRDGTGPGGRDGAAADAGGAGAREADGGRPGDADLRDDAGPDGGARGARDGDGDAGDGDDPGLLSAVLGVRDDEVPELVVRVGTERLRFPLPGAVAVDDDPEDGDGVGISLRW